VTRPLETGMIRRAIAPAAAVAACVVLLTAPAAYAGTYTVRWGDTLSAIASSHHVSLLRLARINHIGAYGVLQTGRVLRVPGHRRSHHHRQGPITITAHTIAATSTVVSTPCARARRSRPSPRDTTRAFESSRTSTVAPAGQSYASALGF